MTGIHAFTKVKNDDKNETKKMNCGYTFYSGKTRGEAAWNNSEYCILHTELPHDTETPEFRRILAILSFRQ
jgi:hypothetical protein